MKRFVAALIALTFAIPYSAVAMGSGDKYQDLQTGVTYVVYKPTNTLKLPALNFEVRPCRLFPKKDQYLLAGFGGMDQAPRSASRRDRAELLRRICKQGTSS